jgi:hypothetical protein
MDALPRLAPVSGAYASMPVADAFNWADGADELETGEWYLVAFRSVRAAGADESKLDEFDERAHLEAAASPGFIHYLKGPRAADGSCMSFCLWQSRADARAAAGKPDHIKAVSLLEEMYETYALEYVTVRREAGGALTFEPYPLPPHAFGHLADPAPSLEPAADADPITDLAVPQLGINPAPAG